MKFLSLYVLLLLLLTGACQSSDSSSPRQESGKFNTVNKSNDKQIQNTDTLDFQAYLSFIPSLELPLSFDCLQNELPVVEINENHNINKFLPEGAVLNGKLFENDKGAGIIYSFPADIILPFLYEYDKEGKLISTFQFYDLPDCSGDLEEKNQTYTSIKITGDLNIHKEVVSIKCQQSGGKLHCDTIKQHRVFRFVNE